MRIDFETKHLTLRVEGGLKIVVVGGETVVLL